jgi:aminomethyltransferase
MPIPTPFHSRTSAACESFEWRNWSGYLAAALYEPSHEREYYAIRNAAGVIDVSPLYKYEIAGPDAASLVDRIVTRDVGKCRIGQVLYTPWCDEHGKVIDDGTVWRLEENRFLITAADPNLRWFQDVGAGLQVSVADVSGDFGTLALQGPLSKAILKEALDEVDLDKLKFFHLAEGMVDGFPVTVTRTGYTGDLGYELWVRPEHAERLWDCLFEPGQNYGLLPAGLVVLDIARIEAGLLLIEIDYISARYAKIEAQKSSPFEIGLGWTVALDGANFVGRKALLAEKESGSKWAFVGLRVDWLDLERRYAEVDLPPLVAGRASRAAVPIYKSGKQVGQATSYTFSPILKQYVALGTVLSEFAAIGERLEMEITVEYRRTTARATVVTIPFFEPERKRS